MMRSLLALALLSLVLPVASASAGAPDVECDMDDDLYQHCRAGRVHWVTGPGCAGVRLDAPAPCRAIVDPR